MIALVLLLLSFSNAGERVDVLFLPNPGAYSILNQYEQPLSGEDKRLFSSPVPLIILSRDELLGDQITSALKGSAYGAIWYVLKDGDGRFKGNPDSSGRRELKACVLLNDTIRIKKPQRVAYGPSPSKAQGSGYFAGSEHLGRLFQYQAVFCLATLSGPQKIRWSALTPADGWEQVRLPKSTNISDTLDQASCAAVSAICAEVNKTYVAFFTYFNTLTGQDKSAPRWKTICTSAEIRCTLSAASGMGGMLYQSTQYMARNLENALLGKPVAVTLSADEIVIKTRGNAQ